MAREDRRIRAYESDRISPPPIRSPRALRLEIICTWFGIALTSLVALYCLANIAVNPVRQIHADSIPIWLEDVILIPALAFFFFGQLIYLVCRLGFLYRTQSHRPASRAEIEAIYDGEHPPALLILVPAYCERIEVVRRTMLAAALLEYPDRRVVLLIDDPPIPVNAKAARDLATMREVASEIEILLRPQERRFVAELSDFTLRAERGPLSQIRERLRLEELYVEAAIWMENVASTFDPVDHVDRLFRDDIILKPAAALRARARELKLDAAREGLELSREAIAREYRRLATLFAVRLSCFERKSYVNLSHSMSKAMNLNSYLGLVAHNFRKVIKPDGVHLEECDPAQAQLGVRDAKYVLSVDADTLLLNDYALRLIHLMEQDHNRRVAIAQSPHSACPGSPSLLEREAGAQTNIQRMLCQGSAYYGAAFWVGGSAIMRRAALEDVCEETEERGHSIRKYIQDRTLVEDTESSLTFLAKGWSIYNYLDPLSYSEIPADYGALVVQRRRWSSGGLLNVPALGQYLRTAERRPQRIPEAMLRFHYLASTTVNLGMLLLPLLAIHDKLSSVWLLTAFLYYAFYARDLACCGYSWSDLMSVYALSLLLVTVSVNGVYNSIRQWWTGRKPLFQRTPKIHERTAVPASYIVVTWSIPPAILLIAILDLISGSIQMALLGFLNTLVLSAAVLRFIGLRESWEDLNVVLSRNWPTR
jgi:cellulose synthase/poly-beta-1,6-N-acetylglucosamine synthase-like glycosyltransferase